MMSASNN